MKPKARLSVFLRLIMEEIKYEIDNTYIHYIKFGSGEKVIATISGISLRGIEGFGSAVEKQYEGIKDEYTVYIFDRRKYLNDNASIYDLMEDTYHILREDGVKKAVLFGVSQGGMIACAMAIKHPEFVEKLIIASSSAYSTDMANAVWNKCKEYIKNKDVYNLNMLFYKKVYTEKYFKEYEDAFNTLAKLGTEEEMKRFTILLDMMMAFDCTEELDKIKCPTFVIGAREDEIFGVEASRELSRKLNCDLYVYEDYGHAVYDEAPDYMDRVHKFLD